jgi:hypothetical protein
MGLATGTMKDVDRSTIEGIEADYKIFRTKQNKLINYI